MRVAGAEGSCDGRAAMRFSCGIAGGFHPSYERAFPDKDYGITAADDKGIEESVLQDGQLGKAGDGQRRKGGRSGDWELGKRMVHRMK